MRAVLRVSAVAVLVAGSVGLGLVPAAADDAAPSAVRTNWYWSLAQPNVNGNTLPAPVPAQASGVSAGDLGVGYLVDQIGSVDKAAAVAFDLSAVPAGSLYSSFVATFPYDGSATQLANGNPDISACELIGAFQDAPGPSDLATMPAISLPSCVKGTFSAAAGAKGGYTFDLTAVANDWSGGAPAEGILLRPTPNLATPQPPFTLSLLGKTGIKVAASFTPPAPPPQGPVDVPGPGVVQPPMPGGYVPQPGMGGPIAPAPAPLPAPQVQPPPAVVPPAQALAPVAYRQGALTPSTTWWFGFLGLLALLGLTSMALGDPLAPVAVDPRRRRFAEAVRVQTRAAAPRHARSTMPAHRFRPA